MRQPDACEQTYDYYGDMRTCWLNANHDLGCFDANRAAHHDTIEARTWAAENNRGPWL